LRGIEFVTPSRPDECCGFGGVSAKMGYDKVADHHGAGTEYIVSADMSCLMHQKGCAERARLPIG
jgi:L-lactate dehydrogenase complex protein LldE